MIAFYVQVFPAGELEPEPGYVMGGGVSQTMGADAKYTSLDGFGYTSGTLGFDYGSNTDSETIRFHGSR